MRETRVNKFAFASFYDSWKKKKSFIFTEILLKIFSLSIFPNIHMCMYYLYAFIENTICELFVMHDDAFEKINMLLHRKQNILTFKFYCKADIYYMHPTLSQRSANSYCIYTNKTKFVVKWAKAPESMRNIRIYRFFLTPKI